VNTSDDREAEFESRARRLLEGSVENLDAHTRSRLNQARHAALAQLELTPGRSGAHRFMRWLLPAGGTLAAAVTAIVVWNGAGNLSGQPGGRAGVPDVALEDVDLVSTEENLDLLENVEFYSWLDKELAGSGGAASGARDGAGDGIG